MKLRPYQSEGLDVIERELLSFGRALCVLPTGSGKTVMFMELIKRMKLKTLVVVKQVTLVEQTARLIEGAGIYCGTLQRKDTTTQVIVASINSIYKVPIDDVGLIILDEAHNGITPDQASRYFKFLSKHPKVKVAGFTATPFRPSGYIYGPGKFFVHVSYTKTLESMIESDYLVRPYMKRPDHQFDVSKLRVRHGEYAAEDVIKLTSDEEKAKLQVGDALDRLEGRKKVFWCCSSIKHADLVVKLLDDSFEHAIAVHSDSSDPLEHFTKGSVRHCVFVSMLTEGFDYPPADALVLMRPIRSPVLYVQVCGRVLRSFEGKEDALILDYGKCVEFLGPLSSPRVIERGKGKARDYKQVLMKFCPKCLEYISVTAKVCPACSHVIVVPTIISKVTTLVADETSDILKLTVRTAEINQVKLQYYISKSKNPCLTITYYPRGTFMSSMIEYFPVSFKKPLYRKRLVELGLDTDLEPKQDGQSLTVPVSASVDYVHGKYIEIRAVRADRDFRLAKL